jgi:hypothetical protein
MALAPKLKEDPKEWRTFSLSSCVAVGLVLFQLHRKGRIGDPAWHGALAGLALVALLALALPRLFRPVYRIGMTVGFHLGQVVGRVLLIGVFMFAIVPIGLLLRCLGKDLLLRKWDPAAATYWQPARPPGSLDRMF